MNEALAFVLILFACAMGYWIIKWLWALKDILVVGIVAVVLGLVAYEYIISPSLGG